MVFNASKRFLRFNMQVYDKITEIRSNEISFLHCGEIIENNPAILFFYLKLTGSGDGMKLIRTELIKTEQDEGGRKTTGASYGEISRRN